MKQLLVLCLCVASCLSSNWHEEHRPENLKRKLQLELLERELAADEGLGLEGAEVEEDLDSVFVGLHSAQSEREFQKKQVIEDCIQGDVILVVDSSDSIGRDNWQYVLEYIYQMIDRLPVAPQGTHVGLVIFGNRAHTVFNLNNFTDPEHMKAVVSKTQFLGFNSNISGAIYTAHKNMFTKANGDRAWAPNIMVIMTDGSSTYDSALTIPYAVEAKNNNVVIICIGMGAELNEAELDGMASKGKNGRPIVVLAGGYGTQEVINEQLINVACDTEVDD